MNNPKTKIFLDSGDPEETKQAIDDIGFLDGQTTNPTLVAKNPEIKEYLSKGKKLTEAEIYNRYQKIVEEISSIIPNGSVSVEVYADKNTPANKMFEEGKKMFSWIPNAHIKYPTTEAGLEAAEKSIKENMRVNMTLCFTQAQAAAVYSATRGAENGDVFVSPFIGRLDDRGENGMSLIKNIMENYKSGDGHVEVLAASVRSMEHFMYSIALGVDIITAPPKILSDWGKAGTPIPNKDFAYPSSELEDIPYENIDLNKPWREYDYNHELTDTGMKKFATDWNDLIAQN